MPAVPIPPALRAAADRWRVRPHEQEPMGWNVESWRRWLRGDDHTDLLTSLPAALDRADVARHARDAPTSEDAAVRAFVVMMIWGYGTGGLGPYRTARILDPEVNPEPGSRLVEVARRAASGDWSTAFTEAAKPGLKHLNRAFGSKYLYFCSLAADDDRAVAPILDSVVAQWFRTHTTFRPRNTGWDLGEYREFMRIVHGWADELGVRADTVEQLIFDSEWAPPANLETPRAEMTRLLARLQVVTGELDHEVAERCTPHIDELRRLCDREPDDGG